MMDRYTDEKITQILSSDYVSQEFSPKSNPRGLKLCRNFIL